MAKTRARAGSKRPATAAAKRRRTSEDDLESYIAARTARNPEFGRLLDEAAERKRLLTELAATRRASGLSQTVVASRMNTSTSAVARLEQGDSNPTLGTLQRFASALGKRVELRLADDR